MQMGCHVATSQEGRDRGREEGLELKGLEPMQTNTHRTHQCHILLRRQNCSWVELRRIGEWMRRAKRGSKSLESQPVTGEKEGDLGVKRDAGSVVLLAERTGGREKTIKRNRLVAGGTVPLEEHGMLVTGEEISRFPVETVIGHAFLETGGANLGGLFGQEEVVK